MSYERYGGKAKYLATKTEREARRYATSRMRKCACGNVASLGETTCSRHREDANDLTSLRRAKLLSEQRLGERFKRIAQLAIFFSKVGNK
jgi:hypothetical protein